MKNHILKTFLITLLFFILPISAVFAQSGSPAFIVDETILEIENTETTENLYEAAGETEGVILSDFAEATSDKEEVQNGEDIIEEEPTVGDKFFETKQQIRELGEKSEMDSVIDDMEDEILKMEIERQNIEEINASIQKEIEGIKGKLEENEQLKLDLEASKEAKEVADSKRSSLESENASLKNLLAEKQNLIQKNNEMIQELSNAQVLKEYLLKQNVELKKSLDEKKQSENNEKLVIFYLVIGLYAILQLTSRYFYKKYKKSYKQIHTYVTIVSAIVFLGFLVWFFFYIKPEMIILVFFLASAVIVVNKEFIVSFISSLVIVNKYRIGQKVRYKDTEGLITHLTPLNVVLCKVDKHDRSLGEYQQIPNAHFLHSEVDVLHSSKLKVASFLVVFDGKFSKSYVQMIADIEKKVLKAVKKSNEKFEYFIDSSYNDKGKLEVRFSWKAASDVSKEIKGKIVEYVEGERR